MSGANRSEKATPKRLREARREGRLPRTPELGASLALLVATWLIPLTLRLTATRAQQLWEAVQQVVAHPEPVVALRLLKTTTLDAAVAAAPLALGMMAIGVAVSAAQGGVHLATKAVKPKLSRLNPLPGFKRLAGPTGAMELGKSLAKTALLALLGWQAVRGLVRQLTGSGALSLDTAAVATLDSVIRLARVMAVAGLVLAVADYAMKRRQAMKTLRMTKQEVKEEHRQSEGDPQLKSAIRSRQVAISRNRMMQEIASADVVVVNPTHVAVALRYRAGQGAPVVVAKGAGVVAARIRREAETHRVPMVSDVPLARTIYKLCRLGDPVPAELYEAVARVLAFVFALRARAKAARPGVRPGPLPSYRPAA